MKVIRSIPAAMRFCAGASQPLALVPTMGALHAGHTALLDRAREVVGPDGIVVASIFVNPMQFGPKEDFSRYPRPLAADQKLCRKHGVDLLFVPDAEAMYPTGFSTSVNEDQVSRHLCGASRPGHFQGVCTVVMKLFQIVQPDCALFGLKDFQQLTVIRKMARDLNMPIQIVPVEIVREPDGLALSSRNRFLTPEERAQAPVLQYALSLARDAFKKGERRPAQIRRLITRALSETSLARIDYVEIADADTLEPVRRLEKNCVIAMAVFFGKTRLIDNLWLR